MNPTITDALVSALGISSPAAGFIYTIAGNGTYGSTGDGSLANAAGVEVAYPTGIVVDSNGNVSIATEDAVTSVANGNDRIRQIAGTTGVISIYASSTGAPGYNGDNISAAAAQLYNPSGLALDSAGNLYLGDAYNRRVRKIAP